MFTFGVPVVPDVCRTKMASVALTGTQSWPLTDETSSVQQKSLPVMKLAVVKL